MSDEVQESVACELERLNKLLEEQRRSARVGDRLEAIVGDDEWWEEVSLSQYDGDIRRALRDELEWLD